MDDRASGWWTRSSTTSSRSSWVARPRTWLPLGRTVDWRRQRPHERCRRDVFQSRGVASSVSDGKGVLPSAPSRLLERRAIVVGWGSLGAVSWRGCRDDTNQ
jgi:hypothetical protein